MPDISQLFQLGQQVQGRLTQMQTELAQQRVSGSAGGGLVTAPADGRGQVRSIKIDPSIVAEGAVEMLEDLVVAAVMDVQRKADEVSRAELKKLTGGMSLPFQFPI
jgi:DNA-binding YbaB/EbfC family protein